MDGDLVGFVSGYKVPNKVVSKVDTLFIWQVAVAESARGLGLASRMLAEILDRQECATVEYLETTITQDNKASWALFEGLAKKRSITLQRLDWMDKELHFSGLHDSETLVRIGPFTRTTK